MIMRRNLIPIGLAALLAAGAVGALVAAQPPAQEHGTQSIAGWEISGGGGILIMTRRIGDNQIEYAIVGGSHAAPVSERYRVETRAEGGSCADERRVAVSNPFPAERGGEIRAQIVARLAAMDPSCALRLAQNAALIAGFEAAYEA